MGQLPWWCTWCDFFQTTYGNYKSNLTHWIHTHGSTLPYFGICWFFIFMSSVNLGRWIQRMQFLIVNVTSCIVVVRICSWIHMPISNVTTLAHVFCTPTNITKLGHAPSYDISNKYTMKKWGDLQLALQLGFWVAMIICNILQHNVFLWCECYQISCMNCKGCNWVHVKLYTYETQL